jgi:hypothetical protein
MRVHREPHECFDFGPGQLPRARGEAIRLDLGFGNASCKGRGHCVDKRPIANQHVALLEPDYTSCTTLFTYPREHVFLPRVSDTRPPPFAVRAPT